MRLPLPMDDPAAHCSSGLYVVATPIGNLEDITLRALSTLAGVDLIAAEDTRHTARLLSRYQIRTPLISCHEYNEHQRIADLLDQIRGGSAVALVSDAGTPSVSDPGYRLVCAAAAAGVKVIPIPGVSAVVTALSASAMPTDAFVFVGFAPKRKGRRMTLLASLAGESRTMAFYESPRRVLALLEDLQGVMGDRPAVLGREMTKLHEEFIRGPLSVIHSTLAARGMIKGECTLLVSGAPATPVDTDDLADALRDALSQPGVHIASLAKRLAQRYHLPRNTVYAMALSIRNEIEGSR